MEKINQTIYASEAFQKLRQHTVTLTAGQSLTLTSVAGSLLAFVAAHVFDARKTQILMIASDEARAEKLRDDCALLLGEGSVKYFGARPIHPGQSLDVTASVAQVEALKSLTSNAPVVVIASPQSIIEKVPQKNNFSKSIIELGVNQEYNFQDLIRRVEEIGFERKEFVEGVGDVAVRGGIIDVFPHVGENPIRFEFWGNTIESIREFDVLSQRSIKELQIVSIVPGISGTSTETDEGRQSSSSLFEYLQNNALLILDDLALIKKEAEELFSEGTTSLFTFQELANFLRKFPTITNSTLREHTPTFTNQLSHLKLEIESSPQPAYNGSINTLIRDIEKLSSEGYNIMLMCDTEGEAKRLNELIEEVLTAPATPDQLPPHEVEQDVSIISNKKLNYTIVHEAVHSGFIYHPAKIAIFTEHEIFGRLKKRGVTKRRRFKGFTQKELQQLKSGDYVVHVDHGIGSFGGLKKINVGGVEQEVMKLIFLENDLLYVNLNFINRVQKYSSQEGHVPKLNKLGTADWKRAKDRAKRRIKDIARDIIALYARRKHEEGFAFSSDTHWQKELEASFMYEDTPDQAQATLDVKNDMESSSPMDRLVCGDVGFGKTEIAVRAAFKAVMNGKQVAVLVPTTILAIQHYNTFHDRLSRYTTRIEQITRFKSAKEQRIIVEGLRHGSVDIIIGTHRLLSKDIAFKDLGLLIIDEEHRFGVSAKEKLRKLKASVDTLALTATPIPRTLHFSMIGARDLSLMTTPPRNRLPIMTDIIPADSQGKEIHWRIIREGILREMHRGGQAYFVHDRVHNIEAIVENLRRHIPEARIHIAHGQMSGHELEKTMLDFLEKKYDVLVCTKIIESGLDIPNVNTIIINRADMFGLAELYQLRGRVGRSNVQAYAYLLTPPLSIMPKQTLRRLQAIEEFTELGSGFNLAMRDLEIRGAGNLLGAEQSGFIMEMGFEMYERIVREAVEELKREEFKELLEQQEGGGQISARSPVETVIESDIEALIPDFYIESDTERLDIYRRLYRMTTEDELKMMRGELQDRFGEYPEEVENLFQLVQLRLKASEAGLAKVSLKEDVLTIVLPGETDQAFYGTPGNDHSPFQLIMKRIADGTLKDVRLKEIKKELMLEVRLKAADNASDRLEAARRKMMEVAAG